MKCFSIYQELAGENNDTDKYKSCKTYMCMSHDINNEMIKMC